MEIFDGLRKEKEHLTARNIVVKIGTRTLCEDGGMVRTDFVRTIAEQVSDLRKEGINTILVCSGAVELSKLRSDSVRDKRVAAAMGQPLLMHIWNKAFYPLPVLQFLLTESDLEKREEVQYSLVEGLAIGIPVVNGPGGENNDSHASKVAQIMEAEMLVLLTNKPGVLDKKEKTVPLVQRFGDVAEFVSDDSSAGGSGGMGVKAAEALSFVQTTGHEAFIAHGQQRDILRHLVNGYYQGTTRFARA